MDHVKIWSEMDRLTAMMVEKGFLDTEAEIWMKSGEQIQLNLWGQDFTEVVILATTPDECIAAAEDHIAALTLTSAAERNLSEFQKKVAEAIDFGNEHGIDVQWVNPLIEMSRSLASNALPAPGDR